MTLMGALDASSVSATPNVRVAFILCNHRTCLGLDACLQSSADMMGVCAFREAIGLAGYSRI